LVGVNPNAGLEVGTEASILWCTTLFWWANLFCTKWIN